MFSVEIELRRMKVKTSIWALLIFHRGTFFYMGFIYFADATKLRTWILSTKCGYCLISKNQNSLTNDGSVELKMVLKM